MPTNASHISGAVLLIALLAGWSGSAAASDPSSINNNQSHGSIAVLGIGHEVPSSNAFEAGLDPSLGREVVFVYPNSTASRLGLQEGDVIVGINGIPVVDGSSLRRELVISAVGDPIALEVWRDGQTLNVGGNIIPGNARWRSDGPDEDELAEEREYRQEQQERLDRKLRNFSDDYQQVQKLREEVEKLKELEKQKEAEELLREAEELKKSRGNADASHGSDVSVLSLTKAWILRWRFGQVN